MSNVRKRITPRNGLQTRVKEGAKRKAEHDRAARKEAQKADLAERFACLDADLEGLR